ncbi:MAG: delta-60 repeat domain-containing protein [Candidatus Nitrotoga sp. MKT]|nr:MAG: delta-60 repeat domain-containing protein [Candidatus Nitrotoga sp. MKT]
MSSLLKVSGTVATKKIFAILFVLIALHVTMFKTHAAPALDSSFGNSGIVRIGVPSGAEDTPSASVLQRDGKLLLAGGTARRPSHAFVLRLLPNGVPDTTFGQNGVALFNLPNGDHYAIQQLEQGADGSILINGSNGNGLVLTRLTATGILDTSFGTQGFFSVRGAPASFVQQPDGGLLIVSDATQGSQFALRLTRLNPAGVLDSTYAPNGEKILSGLPSYFEMAPGVSVVAEPNGGFTVMAKTTISGSSSTYLLVRLTAAGTLNFGFGDGGFVRGYAVDNHFDRPVTMVRTANGGLLLMGDSVTLPSYPFDATYANSKVVLWRVTADGLADASLGTAGRLELGSIDSYIYSYSLRFDFKLAALSDGSIALVNAVDATTARVSHFDASGVLDSAFGAAGSSTIALVGYSTLSAISILPNGVGGLLIPAVAGLTLECSPLSDCVPRGVDAAVASLNGSGHLQTSYGRGDGFAVVNTAEYSNDKVDAILVETSGKVVLAGSSDVDATFDYFLERLTANGSPDIAFGTNGRVAPGKNTRFMGKARVAEQASGAITVVAGTGSGSILPFGTITAFQLDAAGMLNAGFAPSLAAPSWSNTDIALGIRPDGRLLYGTTTGGSAILQQTMSDGTPDLSFSTDGKTEFPLPAGENSFYADMALLGDGSVVFAVQTEYNLHLYKVDSHGLPVASFGTVGQFTYASTDPFSFGGAPFSLLSLSDGSLLAGIGINQYAPSSNSFSGSLLAIRVSSNGMLLGANNLLAGQGEFTWNFAALPDASVVVARSYSNGQTKSTALYRLLPNNSFDMSFGINGAYSLPGMFSVDALALDAHSRLLVAGQDATSAVLARYELNGTIASTPIVEFYNTHLDHYFITADANEAAGIDGGSAGPGWIRTGNSFKSGGSTPVCRFYGSQVPGPNSHFYTVAGAECDGLKQLQAITPSTQKRWNFESLDFISTPPTNGTCPTGTTPVYRAYNNGFARGVDSNHRFSSDAAAIQEVVARGWINEGVAMCAPI